MAAKITLGPMRPHEAELVSMLMRTVILGAKVYNLKARRTESAKYTPEILLSKTNSWNKAVLVARVDSAVSGFVVSELQDGVLWISWLGVSPGARGLGLGSRLMRKVEAVAREAGLHKIWCDSRVHNLPVRHLLTDLNYESVCTLKRHWFGQDFMLWQKFLD